MPLDRSFVELNRASTARIRTLVDQLTDQQLQHPVGEHWTVAITLAHLAFWERRLLQILAETEASGKLDPPVIDTVVNDLSLPLWAAVPPRSAARLAVESSQEVDQRLENYPSDLLEQIYARLDRWVVRSLHRNEHLDEIDAALQA
jgi:hypothetical protein